MSAEPIAESVSVNLGLGNILLTDLVDAGYRVSLDDDGLLRVLGPQMSDELRDKINRHRQSIIAVLLERRRLRQVPRSVHVVQPEPIHAVNPFDEDELDPPIPDVPRLVLTQRDSLYDAIVDIYRRGDLDDAESISERSRLNLLVYALNEQYPGLWRVPRARGERGDRGRPAGDDAEACEKAEGAQRVGSPGSRSISAAGGSRDRVSDR